MLQDMWRNVQTTVAAELGEDVFRSWIQHLRPITLDGSVLVFHVPSAFVGTWVANHYEGTIFKHLSKVLPQLKKIEWKENGHIETISETKEALPAIKKTEEAVPLDVQFLDSRFVFENFVVGRPNELAYAAAIRVSESEEPPFNPLFLYGGVGLGKTHLMHAIAWNIKKKNSQKRILYTSAEKFMYQFVQSVRYKNTTDFKEKFRSVDVLMVDDVQFIGGKDTTQEEFFHTFNALVDNNRQVVISADKSPFDLDKVEERLKSRLGWGLVADIHPTTYELRLGILQSKAEKMGLEISKEILELLASKITSNIRELEGALNRIAAYAVLGEKRLDSYNIQILLKDLLKGYERVVTIEEIQKKVCEYYSIRASDMLSQKRDRNLARPRQIAVYLSKELTTRSLPDIGRKFSGRDHTTVLHAVRKIQELLATDKEIESDIRLLTADLEALKNRYLRAQVRIISYSATFSSLNSCGWYPSTVSKTTGPMTGGIV